MVSPHPRVVEVAVIATHVGPATGFGGIAESVLRRVRAWAAAGHSFSLCASDASLSAPVGVSDLKLPADVPVRLYTCRRWRHMGFGWGGVIAVFRACRDARTVYIDGLATWPTMLARLYCVLLGRPMLVAPHSGLMPSFLSLVRRRKPLKRLLYFFVELPLIRRAAALHVTSPLEAAGLGDTLPGIPIHIVPNGLDPADWPAQPDRSPDGGLTLCYVGRLSPEKGILRFLRLWKTVRRPGDRFLIVGSGQGAYAEAVAAEAKACPEAVELAGYLGADGVRAWLARADMLVLPSGIEGGDLRENFGNSVIEALASQRPVLVAAGLAWDMAETQGFGLLFSASDDAMARALDRAARLSVEQRNEMGRAGRRYVLNNFDQADVSARLWEIVLSLRGR